MGDGTEVMIFNGHIHIYIYITCYVDLVFYDVESILC